MLAPPLPRIFVATRLEDIPAGVSIYYSVDGSVPGARKTWDHHVTGERVNLDTFRPDEVVDLQGVDGVGTTLADTDALACVVAVLAGGPSRLEPGVRDLLYAASHRCDHLSAAPGMPAAIDAAGAAFERWVSARLAAVPYGVRSNEFERLCLDVFGRVTRGEALPGLDESAEHHERARQLAESGRVWHTRHSVVFDLRRVPSLPVEALYRGQTQPIGVFVSSRDDGGVKYTVGVNPESADPPSHLRPLLVALAAAEFAHGPPCLGPDPVPGAANWGGRQTVFGSPWDYGSRLTVEQVVAAVDAFGDAHLLKPPPARL